MHIEILDRFRPFSQIPGTTCVLPYTNYAVEIFPGLIKIYDISVPIPKELLKLTLDLEGPVKKFLVFLDLEKGLIAVQGFFADQYVNYYLQNHEKGEGISFFVKKGPLKGIRINDGFNSKLLKDGDSLLLLSHLRSNEMYKSNNLERLSLGNNKAQDWNMVLRRLDLKEIFPIWHRLGQMVKDNSVMIEQIGNLKLVQECRETIANGEVNHIEETFLNLFKAGFYSLLMPQLKDNKFQCLSSMDGDFSDSISPLFLLTEGSKLIHSLFINEVGSHEINILPVLPPCFPSGRFIQIPIKQGLLNIEWSKKIIRRVILYSFMDGELILNFKKVGSCRLRKGEHDKGGKFQVNHSLKIEKKSLYFFDNFS